MEKDFHNFLIKNSRKFFCCVFFLAFFILFLSTVSSLKTSLNCPNDIGELSEFECSVLIEDFEENLDTKIEIEGNGSLINQIWIGDKWQRADWYYKDSIKGNGEWKFRLKIHKDFIGEGKIKFALRKNTNQKVIYNETKSIFIKQKEENNKNVKQESLQNQQQKDEDLNKEKYEEDNKTIQISKEIISLNQIKIDINTASLKELTKIIGIGEKTAKEIINTRPFCSIDELVKVKGIGNATLEKIKQQGLAFVEKDFVEKNCIENKENYLTNLDKKEEDVNNEVVHNKIKDDETEKIIKLNPKKIKEQEAKIVYQSKSEIIRRYAIYFFSFFLFLIIVLIMKER